MKKISFQLLFLICFTSVTAQVWCPPGAEWTYSYTYTFPTSNGYVILKYVNDSVINTKTYKKINSTFYGYNAAYGSGTVTINQGYYLLNQNAKLISLYNGYSPDDTLFNFNANIGDKWLRVRYFNDVSCDAQRQQVTVLDTGSVIINSVSLKKLVLAYVRGMWVGGPTTSYNDTVYEKIGSVKNHLVPWTCETNFAMPGKSGTYPVGNFRCYKDNSFPTYQHPGTPSCYTIVGLNILELENDFFVTIYPNPVTNSLHLKSEKIKLDNSMIEISSALGQVIIKLSYKNEIDISQLSRGCYFLKITTTDKVQFYSKFIKE